MPPRKSNASTVDEGNSSMQDGISIEDLGLPRTMVQRLAKGVLPPNTQVSKDALLAIQKSATVFISYLASHANENTLRGNKKTIQAQDVLDALTDIEFPSFTERCHNEHQKFSSIQNDKRNSYRRKVKEEKLAAAAKFADEHVGTARQPSSPHESFHTANGSVDGMASPPAVRKGEDDEPKAKKARREDGDESDAEMEDEAGVEEGEDEGDDEEPEDDGESEEEDEGDGADQLVEDALETRDDRGVEDSEEDSD